MDTHERAALEHQNWIGYLTGVVGCSPGAIVRRTGGVVSILTGLPFDWLNQILLEHDDATTDELAGAVDWARAHGRSFVVRLREGIDDRSIPLVERLGLTAAGDGVTTPGMVAFPIDRNRIASVQRPGFEIRRVTDVAGIDVHRRMVTEGFGSDPVVALGTACPELLDRPGCVVYVGYADGAPVMSGMGWRTGRTIGVYAIATIPSARRRGYGAAMTARVVADGLAAGCDVAALQASELGRPIYERVGFQVDVRYVAYGDSSPDV